MMITAFIQSRLGRFTVTISDGEPGSAVLKLASVPVITYGRLDLAYAGVLLPSYTSLTLIDEGGLIRNTFFDFEETDWLVTIRMIDSSGGPGFLWKGRPRKGNRPRPTAPRVRGEVQTLDVYDRLGALAEIQPGPLVGLDRARLGTLFYEGLQQALPLDVLFFNEVWPTAAGGSLIEDVREIRFAEELASSGEEDYATLREQMETGAGPFGLRVFQSPTDATWRVMHRPAIGEAVMGQRAEAVGGVWSEALIEPDQYALAAQDVRAEEEDVIDAIGRLGRVTVFLGDTYNLIRDGWFAAWEETTPLYWEHEGPVEQVDTTGMGAPYEIDPPTAARLSSLFTGPRPMLAQNIIGVAPQSGIHPRLTFSFMQPDDGGLDPPEDAFDIKYIVRLDGSDGQTYYWNATSEAWETEEVENLETALISPVRWSMVEVIMPDPPVAGLLRVAFGVDGDPEFELWLSGVMFDFVRYPPGELLPVPVPRVALGISGEGRSVEISPVAVEAWNGSEWLLPADWTSERYPSNGDDPSHYGHLFIFTADDLLQQQGQDAPVLAATVWGLHGPGRRLLFDLDEDGEAEHLIAEGLQLNLEDGTTRGVWPALPSALTSGS